MNSNQHHVIIGGSIAGITLARELRKGSTFEITVVSDESQYFFSRPALMYVFMGDMKFEHIKPYEDWFWKKNNIKLVYDKVLDIDIGQKKIFFSSEKSIQYDKLTIATGSKLNKAGWPGQELNGVQGFYSLWDLRLLEKNVQKAKRAVIVGGGLIGIEVAEMLIRRNIEVIFLVREKNYWGSVLPAKDSKVIENEIAEHGVDLRLNTSLKEIHADQNGRVEAVSTLEGNEKIQCQLVVLTTGVVPNIDFIKSKGIETDEGILVNERFGTNDENIYAIGDCAQFKSSIKYSSYNKKSVYIEKNWYAAKRQAETLAKFLLGKQVSYNPGVFFNSAKFFNVEYSVYGYVPNKAMENSFLWKPKNKKMALRFSFDASSKKIVGIHALGIRLREEVCRRWVTSQEDIYNVFDSIEDAFFEPEFFQKYGKDIRACFYNGEKK